MTKRSNVKPIICHFFRAGSHTVFIYCVSQSSLETDLLLKWIMMSSGTGAVRDLRVCGFDRNRFLVLRLEHRVDRGHVPRTCSEDPRTCSATGVRKPRCSPTVPGVFASSAEGFLAIYAAEEPEPRPCVEQRHLTGPAIPEWNLTPKVCWINLCEQDLSHKANTLPVMWLGKHIQRGDTYTTACKWGVKISELIAMQHFSRRLIILGCCFFVLF